MISTSPNMSKSPVYLAKSWQRLTSWVSHQTIRSAPLFQADELFRSIRGGSPCSFLLLKRLAGPSIILHLVDTLAIPR
jgi:hypothetical protein